jgi:hypothetical protein
MTLNGKSITFKFCKYCGSFYRHIESVDQDYKYMRILESFTELRGLDYNILKVDSCERCDHINKVQLRKTLVGV